MKNYYITITYLDPFPKIGEYRTKGTRFSVGIKRAVDLWHKNDKRRGSIVKNIAIKVAEI